MNENLPVPIWRPDVNRYLSEQAYAGAVDEFVARHIPRASASGAEVIQASDGERALKAFSFFDDTGEYFRGPSGEVVQGVRWALLSRDEVLP